jgi:hypothetical protein
MFDYVPAEIVGFVYGTAGDPGEIRQQDEVMRRASELGSELVAAI